MSIHPDVEIRHLRCFLAVAETENFTRAAERLHITQPSVSQQMRDLERKIGASLFARAGHRVRLTQAGATLRGHAEAVLRKLDEAGQAMSAAAGLLTGHVAIGVIPALHLAWIPGLLRHVARDYPGVTVAVVELASRFVETEIEAGRFDLGLGFMSRTSSSLRYRSLLTEKFALIVPPRHALAQRRSLRLRELNGLALVLLPQEFDMRRAVDDMFLAARQRPRVAFEIDSIDSTLTTVLRTGRPTVLPPIVLRGREALGLRAVSIQESRRLQFGLMAPREHESSPAARVLAKLLARSERREPRA